MEDIKDSEIRFIGKDKTYDKETVPITAQDEVSSDASKAAPKSREAEVNPRRDEPRTIQPDKQGGHYNKLRDSWSIRALLIILILAFIVISVVYYIFSSPASEPPVVMDARPSDDLENAMFDPEVPEGRFESQESAPNTVYIDSVLTVPASTTAAYCQTKETEVNGIRLKIMIPMGAVPEFEFGRINENDSRIILALQAADIRKDNGEIVGASVHNGKVVGRGVAKKGYVSIINGKVKVGVSDHSPLFEAAIQEGGDFFRQYPLVADGVMIENQPKGKSVRRAICQRGDELFVIESMTTESFHDFAQALQDMQIDNAVYLVGSKYALGFLRDSEHALHSWGEMKFDDYQSVSFLVWRAQ